MTAKMDPNTVDTFLRSGNARLTVVRPARTTKDGSAEPEVRFTFHVQRARGEEESRPWFCKVLTGRDNRYDFSFVGSLFPEGPRLVYRHGTKARINDDSPSVRCLVWLVEALNRLGSASRAASVAAQTLFPPEPKVMAEVAAALQALNRVEVWHDGKCGRCRRDLTVPESVARGLGPECAEKGA